MGAKAKDKNVKQPGDYAIEFDKISKAFKGKTVLKDVSFSVKKGEVFGLVGLNGIGKTTLIKTLIGLLQPDSGAVKVFSNSIEIEKNKGNISYLPEKFQPSTHLNGREFLEISLQFFGKKLNFEHALSVAEEFDLSGESLTTKISKYSKGMGQKLGLMAAFLSKAPILILDEPMSGLDPQSRIKLKDYIFKYKRDGNTVFFSSHILADVDEICDSIAILHDGGINFIGTPEELKKKFFDGYLERAFLKSIGRYR